MNPTVGKVAAVVCLAERLGYAPEDRLVILSCDDLGSCHAANVGVFQAMRDGAATCASLMVPAPWARHAASMYEPSDDVGVHLTLNAEHDVYRWGPITHAPSLLSGEGGFPRTVDDLWEHADTEEVYSELQAQVERAMIWGVDVTHLAPHLSAILLRPEFFGVYLDLAEHYRLPVRLPSAVSEKAAGFEFRNLAREAGVLFPDHFDHDWRAGSRERVTLALANLAPGVTELHVQPAIDTPEVHALSSHANAWIDDHVFMMTGGVDELIAEAGAVAIGYRELRDAMRS